MRALVSEIFISNGANHVKQPWKRGPTQASERMAKSQRKGWELGKVLEANHYSCGREYENVQEQVAINIWQGGQKPQEDTKGFDQNRFEQELKSSRAPDIISRGTPCYRRRYINCLAHERGDKAVLQFSGKRR